MKVKQKNIVLIKFPFTDLSFNKIRPALVVSNNDFNLIGNDFLLIPLTSILKDVKYSLLLEESDLIVKSRLRVDKITSLDKELIF